MSIPMTNVETKIKSRRQILEDESDLISGPSSGRVSADNGTEEDTSVDIHVYVEGMIYSQLMTLKQKPHRKNGKMFYIDKMNSTKPTDLSFGDKLVKVGNELLADTTMETIQNHFNFDSDENGRRSKTLTIRRTEDVKTEEIDVEEVLVTKIKSLEHARRRNRFVSPRRPQPRPQKNRNILLVQERPGIDKVLIQTTDGKYLTVKDGAVVGDWMGRNNKNNFVFDLVTVNAMYETNLRRKKQVICCKIKWNTSWLKTTLKADGDLEIEWTEDDADDHTKLFKRRVTSDGRNTTGFESLLLKNVFLQYNSSSNEVEVNSRNSHVNLEKTLRQVPRSSQFKVIELRRRVEMGRRSNIYHSSNARPRSSTLRSYIGNCLPFFRRSSSWYQNGSTDGEWRLPVNDISGRSEQNG
ncbi:uncharacterized protein [Argopecten irradians]|uniref:uncharacterized protein n=1 Tax=Argopecten irradians TaxID=31199 RepID=UPI00372315E1